MITYTESKFFYQKAVNNGIGGITCLGIGLTSELISFIPKKDNVQSPLIYTVSLPAIAGMVYFGIEAGKNRKKAIAAYNKKIVM